MANSKSYPEKVIWQESDGNTREYQFLVDNNKLEIVHFPKKKYLVWSKNGDWKEYPMDSMISFHDIVYDENGKIISLCFKFLEVHKPKYTRCNPKDEITLELQYLLDNGLLTINPEDDDHRYNLKYNNQYHSYPKESFFKFYDIKYDENNDIISLKYLVVVERLNIWKENDSMKSREIRYLKKRYQFCVDQNSIEERLKYFYHGKWKGYPKGYRICFSKRFYDENGALVNAQFKFQRLMWV